MENERNIFKPILESKLFPISMGLFCWMTFGLSLHDWLLGFCLGFQWAIVFGLYEKGNQKNRKKINNYLYLE